MSCPECGARTVGFEIPPDLKEVWPDAGEPASICTRCLHVTEATAEEAGSFSGIIEAFPEGDAGVAMALAVGLLVDSLAMHRERIAGLFEYVQDRGADPWLVLERLAVSPTIEPDADLDRLRRQLDQLLRS